MIHFTKQPYDFFLLGKKFSGGFGKDMDSKQAAEALLYVMTSKMSADIYNHFVEALDEYRNAQEHSTLETFPEEHILNRMQRSYEELNQE
jgi:hypothetical protein